MLQTKDLFGAVDTYMSHQHGSEAILRGDSLGGAGAAPSSSADAKGGKSSGSKGGSGKGGGGKGPSSPTTARCMAELEAHAPTTALAGRLAGCVCSLLRLQLAQLVLRVEALVVAKDANGGGVKGESRKAAAAKKMKAKPKAGSRSRRRSAEDEEDEEEDEEAEEEAEEAKEEEEVAGALGDDEAAVRELLMTSDGF
jgi:hypothetical protein